jgi:hypothetical protein
MDRPVLGPQRRAACATGQQDLDLVCFLSEGLP